MAEALLRSALHGRGVDATVSSAGLFRGGVPASPGSVRAMARRGLDLGEHRSRTLTGDLLEGADLVLGMARLHVKEAVLDEGRRRADLIGDDPADDVADPVGGPDTLYLATATELEDLVGRLVDLAFPVHPVPVNPPDRVASRP
jgi:protein-tyrosine-phosphatase